uniref:Uncharacterized protein n=1 Tax=Solanum lycopersicum TaxID=4081 RepID=A0A3Q7H4M7_SOLLC
MVESVSITTVVKPLMRRFLALLRSSASCLHKLESLSMLIKLGFLRLESESIHGDSSPNPQVCVPTGKWKKMDRWLV